MGEQVNNTPCRSGASTVPVSNRLHAASRCSARGLLTVSCDRLERGQESTYRSIVSRQLNKSSARMFRALVNHSRNGEFCSSSANRSINSRRSCGVSALTYLIILLSASVDIAVSTLPTIYHTDYKRRERQQVNTRIWPKCLKREVVTERVVSRSSVSRYRKSI